MNALDEFMVRATEIRRGVLDGTIDAPANVVFPAGMIAEAYNDLTLMQALNELAKTEISAMIKRLERVYDELNPAAVPMLRGNATVEGPADNATSPKP